MTKLALKLGGRENKKKSESKKKKKQKEKQRVRRRAARAGSAGGMKEMIDAWLARAMAYLERYCRHTKSQERCRHATSVG
jgi:hypothetical protein